SDGTFEGTVSVTPLPAPISNFAVAGSKLFFTVLPSQLWVYDGTTARALGVSPVVTANNDGVLIPVGDRIIFNVPISNSPFGTDLWLSDGTTEGTPLLRRLSTAGAGSLAGNFVPADGLVYFRATDDQHGLCIWSTDGTSEGTVFAANIEPKEQGNIGPRQL